MATSTVIVLASRFAAPVVESIKLSRSIVCTPIVLFSTAILSNLFSIIFVNVPITLVESSSFFLLTTPYFSNTSWRSVRFASPNTVSFA